MQKERFNLLREYNWRGKMIEHLARYNLGIRKNNIIKNPEHKEFIRINYKSLDLFKEDNGRLILYEIKSQIHTARGKIDITENCYKVYKRAIRKGYKVKIVIVKLKDDWNMEFEIKNFNIKYFRINNGGKYKK